MARDFAKTRNQGAASSRTPARKKKPRGSASRSAPSGSKAAQPGRGWRWFSSGLLTGFFLSFLLYLGTLPGGGGQQPVPPAPVPDQVTSEPPRPRFDFYKMLPEQTIDAAVEPAEVAQPRAASTENYLLQAGSFRQREDADRRRAELLLLGLEPTVQQADGDNGQWFRVYIGPFASHSQMARARSLTAGQGIDTLLLKRNTP
jgi:cell division protein FtsN